MINYKKPFKDEASYSSVKTFDPIVEKIDGKKVITYKERVGDPNEGLTYTDFSVSSLLDADAIDLLQPTAPISRDALFAADVAEVAGSTISNSSVVVENENNELKNEEK